MFGFFRSIDLVFRAWPIRPLPMSVFLTLFQILVNFATVIAIARAAGRFAQPIQLIATVPSILIAFVLALSTLFGLKKLGERFPKYVNRFYLLGAVVFGLAMALARKVSINDYTPDYWRDPASLVRIFAISVLLYLTVHITLGVSSLRLAEQVSAAQAAKASLEIQRGKLISAQEDVRRQIADFLHDRLQSDLVLLGMQMQKSVEKLGEQERSIAQAYIDEIERIRQFDVRNVSRQLVPELDGPSLRPALDDLFSRYRKAIKISLQLSEKGSLKPLEKLAAYRIVEQALLNAAKHGNAAEVMVEIRELDQNIRIVVRNDGKPLETGAVPGAGFAIIDEWVSQFGGDWLLGSVDYQTELKVSLKRAL